MRHTALLLFLVCLALPGTAQADEPADPLADPLADAPPADAPPADERSEAEDDPTANEPTTNEVEEITEEITTTIEKVRDVLGTVSAVSQTLGADGVSRDAARLDRALASGQEYAELAVMLALANRPKGLSWQAMVHGSGGAEGLSEQGAVGELALGGGLVITGPSCKLVDVGGQLSFSVPRGVSATQFARGCLGGVSDEEQTMELIRLSGFESAGLNVRPAVAALAVVGSARYSSFEAGLDVEGIRWHYVRGSRSLAGLGLRIAQGWLLQSIASDSRSIATLDIDSWMVEWRVHRGVGALADMTLRFMEIDVNIVESGEAAGAIRIAPFSIAGLGFGGFYVDLSGAVEVTAEEVDNEGNPVNDSEPPHVGTFTWRGAAYAGTPWLHAGIRHESRLIPTLTADLIIEDRTSLFAYLDRGRFFVDAQGFVAHNDLYLDSDDTRDAQADTWGVDALLSLRTSRSTTMGAWIELGRSFYFAEAGDNLDALPDPARGWRAMATFSYGIGRSRPL